MPQQPKAAGDTASPSPLPVIGSGDLGFSQSGPGRSRLYLSDAFWQRMDWLLGEKGVPSAWGPAGKLVVLVG